MEFLTDLTMSPGYEKDLPLDRVRQIVIDKMAEKQITLRDLSVRVGRNTAYIHQFLRRRTPRVLPEETRIAVARALDVHPDLLRHSQEELKSYALARQSSTNRITEDLHVPSVTYTTVPVFGPSDRIDLSVAKTRTERPPELNLVTGGFALWIATDIPPRLRSGDMVFVHPSKPSAVGDLVVVLRGDQVAYIGELGRNRSGAPTIVGSETMTIPRPDDVSILRIVSVRFG